MVKGCNLVNRSMILDMSNIETKTVKTALLTVSVRYKNEFLPGCSIRFYGNGPANSLTGPIELLEDAFPITLNIPVTTFQADLMRPYNKPGDIPVLGARIGLEDFLGPRELVFVILDPAPQGD